MLAVRYAAVEFSFCCSWLLGIMLFDGAGGMTDVGRLTDAVDPSSTALLFSIDSFCSL